MNIRLHAVFALSAAPLFLGALLSDWAYASSHEIQWVNFAAWLIAGGLLIASPALLWGAVDVLRSSATFERLSGNGGCTLGAAAVVMRVGPIG